MSMSEQSSRPAEPAELDARLLGLHWWCTPELPAIRSAPPGRRDLLAYRGTERFSADCDLLLDSRLAVPT